MAELHKFQDKVRSDDGRAKPIRARDLDENFRVVRLKVSSNLATIFRIKENFPQPDELELSLSIPTTGDYVFGFSNGTPTLFETEEC